MTRIMTVLFTLSFTVSCAFMGEQGPPDKSPKQKRGELYYSHGTAKLLSKDYTQALDLLMKALQDIPEDTRVHNNLGMAYYFKNRKQTALKHLNQALELDPKNADARNNYASILFEEGRVEEAQTQYEKIQQNLIYPHQHRVKYNLALIHLRRGNRAKAVELLLQAAKEKEEYCPANFQLGKLYEQTYNYQEALKWYQDSYKGTCHGEPAPHFRAAEVLSAMKQYKKAGLKYESVIDLYPESPYASFSRKRLKEIKETQKLSINSLSTIEDSEKVSSPSF